MTSLTLVLTALAVSVSCDYCPLYTDWEFKSFVITSNSIETLKNAVDSSSSTTITQVSPPITISGASFYLSYASCLGYDGPLGPFGALGYLGPIGSNSWNPSVWIQSVSAIFPSSLNSYYYWNLPSGIEENAFSYYGPLGPNGPLSSTAYCQTLPSINSWSKHLQIGGVFTFLGPLGPLGALGPLGPLGPVGRASVIYNVNNHGQYVDNTGSIITHYTVHNNDDVNDGVYKIYELYENYDTNYAKSNVLDTSWMTDSHLTYRWSEDAYEFESNYNQYVTVLLVPINYYDSFKLEMYINGNSAQGLVSDSGYKQYINGVQLKLNNNDRVTLSVKQGSWRWLGKYRIFVVGAGEDIDGTDISGQHILTSNITIFPFNKVFVLIVCIIVFIKVIGCIVYYDCIKNRKISNNNTDKLQEEDDFIDTGNEQEPFI